MINKGNTLDWYVRPWCKMSNIIYGKSNDREGLHACNNYRLLHEYGEILTRVSIAVTQACECHANANECQYFSIFVQ